jgi:release factor glutamine methyltransferase
LVLEELKGMVRSNLRVIDLGSGSGAIAIALSTERKELEVTAVENSVGALPWLYKNVKTLGPRVRVVAEDVASACAGEEFDIVVANPPYIPKGRLRCTTFKAPRVAAS